MKIILTAFLFALSVSSLATAAPSGDNGEGPCKKIAEACQAAGFIKGDWKKGDGLWADCACPAITGTPNPKATKAGPAIDAGLISSCKTKRPNICAKYHPK